MRFWRSFLSLNRQSALAHSITRETRQFPRYAGHETRNGQVELTGSLRRFLAAREDKGHIKGFLRRRFRELGKRGPLPWQAYEAVLSVLVSQRLHEEAAEIWAKMVAEGYQPSNKISAQLVALTHVANPQSTDEEKVLDSFAALFANKFEEQEFLQFIAFARQLPYSPHDIALLIDVYIDKQAPGYVPSQKLLHILIGLQTSAGMVNEAFETMQRWDLDADKGSYASIILGLGDVPSPDPDSVDKVLHRMRAQEVAADASILNALIYQAVTRKDLRQAFALYDVLLNLAQSTEIRPDHNTFRSLFLISTKKYDPSRRKSHSTPNDDVQVIPPRILFRHMVELYLNKLNSITFKDGYDRIKTLTELLNTALITFIKIRDYAAAVVVIMTFSRYNIPVNITTYYLVARHLSRRLSHCMQYKNQPSWTHRLLGEPDPAVFDGAKFDETHLKRMFTLNDEFNPSTVPRRRSRNHSYQYPTLAQMDQKVKIPLWRGWNENPVKYVLCRSLLAHLDPESQLEGDAAKRFVSTRVSEAEAEMIPA